MKSKVFSISMTKLEGEAPSRQDEILDRGFASITIRDQEAPYLPRVYSFSSKTGETVVQFTERAFREAASSLRKEVPGASILHCNY